jgi:ribosomal protein S12 methylthiotransferase accessory factor
MPIGNAAFAGSNEQAPPPPFDPSAKIEWSPVWSLRDEHPDISASLLYFFHGGPGAIGSRRFNGCAAGNTIEEAIVQGFELVERMPTQSGGTIACSAWRSTSGG